ncbi:rhomboid family intramembrane serine protease [Herbihabitans rhizosphaerae]|uniref:rhomboid family intramembrane serine protease n=1 Tax=Herbihabitans rhizosphaerae TaxID=1872711 RepID=UPI00102BC5C5|nr:rhomboid family intramembrane serine protease [Herbihabitans rhizosphaerae]
MTTLPAKPAGSDPVNRVLPPNPKAAAIVVLGFTALLYLIEFLDSVIPADLDKFGVEPRELSGLDGVLFAPLLHAGWDHLFSNTIPVLVFGFLAMSAGIGQWIAVTGTIWILSGLGVWLTGAWGTVTVGASGVAFGWLAFLLVRGMFNRSFKQLLVAAALFLYWGSTLLGVLPGDPGISWEGHLFGAVAGILAAWLVSVANKASATKARKRADTGGVVT